MSTCYFIDLDQLSNQTFKVLLPRIAAVDTVIRVYAACQDKFNNLKRYVPQVLGTLIFVDPSFCALGKEFADKLMAIDAFEESSKFSRIVIVSNDSDHLDSLRYIAAKNPLINTELMAFNRNVVKRDALCLVGAGISNRVKLSFTKIEARKRVKLKDLK